MCSNLGHCGALSPEKGTSPGKCPACHITSQCVEERDYSPCLPIPDTYQGRAKSIMVISQNTTPRCEVAVRLGHSIWKVSTNDYFYGKHQINIAGLLQARLSSLESVKCAISTPNAFPDTYPRLKGSKLAIFKTKIPPRHFPGGTG